MDFNAFSHGQVKSKIWLCEELEKYLQDNTRIVVLGCWYNTTAFMLFTRNKYDYNKIDGIDFNPENVSIADKINDAWKIENKLDSYFADANNTFYQNYDVVICSSVEDIKENQWYHRIPNGHLVCLQSLNLTNKQIKKYSNWNILNPVKNLTEFKTKYPLQKILYEGSKKFDYDDLKYTRHMLIGIK